jgi:hypothetical protein
MRAHEAHDEPGLVPVGCYFKRVTRALERPSGAYRSGGVRSGLKRRDTIPAATARR